jgi:hypothetical protein
MLNEGEPADAFLGWLGSGKIGNARTRGALMLDEPMRVEILKSTWASFSSRIYIQDAVPRLFRWLQGALSAGIDLQGLGAKGKIGARWSALDGSELEWSLLFQMVWDMASKTERPSLLPSGRFWLERHMERESWPWVYRRLQVFSPTDRALKLLGLRWLEHNARQPAWPGVWGTLYDIRENADNNESTGLVRLSLQAIPMLAESDADLAIWDRTAKLDPPITDLLNAIVHKLVTVRSPYKIDRGCEFLLRFIADNEVVKRLSPALADTMQEDAWAFVWRELVDERPQERDLLGLGRDWLKGRDDEPEWTHVWQKLIDQNFERDTLLPRGRDWLKGRDDEPEWTHVWRKLIDQNFERDTLLPRGRDWLKGRDDEPEWTHVWRKLIDQNFERDTLLPRGRDWLKGRDDEPEWAFVWQKLIDQNFERDTLLPRGRDWLKGRDDEPEWAFVWQKLIDQNFERDTLLPRGRDWLKGREGRPGSHLVQKAMRQG